jgi:hypothetical protein
MQKIVVIALVFLATITGCKKDTASFSHVYNFSFQLNDKTYKPENISLIWVDSMAFALANNPVSGDSYISCFMITPAKTGNIKGQFIASVSPTPSYPNIGTMLFSVMVPNASNTSNTVYTCPYTGPHNNPSLPINEDFSLTITAYDASYMQGIFRGILTDTSNGQQVTVKNGSFNIPYTRQ